MAKHKVFMSAFLLAMLVLTVASVQLVDFVVANYIPGSEAYMTPVYVNYLVESPQKKTYNTSAIPLNFTVTTNSYLSYIPYCYVLDGTVHVTVENITIIGHGSVREYEWLNKPVYNEYTLEGVAVLSDLSDGWHNVTVYNGNIADGFVSKTVRFNVDTAAPNVTVVSLRDGVYNVTDVALDFTVSEAVSRMSYCLDGQAEAAVDGNTTLTSLSRCAHNVTVYAWDAAGNRGTSETVYFAIAEEPEQEQPFPTTIAAVASGASAIAIAAGLLVYFKKFKKRE